MFESVVMTASNAHRTIDAVWRIESARVIAGLALVDTLTSEPSLRCYHLLPAVGGDLLARLGRRDEARDEFERAASLTRSARERELLLERARACADGTMAPDPGWTKRRFHDQNSLCSGLPFMSEQQGANLWEMSDLCTPWCIHVVATLRIAEHIADGKDQIEDLAVAAGCDPYALHRLLTHLVGKGVFEEPSPARFALNTTARGLLDPALRLGLDLEGIGGRMAHAWGTLLSYVRTGRSAYHEHFGRPFWEDLNAHPEVGASFDALMGPLGHGIPNGDFDITGGWDSVSSVVDVGGGTGAMLAELLRKWPDLHGTLVDFPRTVALVGEIFQAAGVSDRVTMIGQSFFNPLPAGKDLYLLKKVLNDWPDREAAAILSRCAEAAKPAGRVVVLGGVGPDEASVGLSIDMVVAGGKHRTVAEFRELARDAGLEVMTAGQPSSGYFVVECRPL